MNNRNPNKTNAAPLPADILALLNDDGKVENVLLKEALADVRKEETERKKKELIEFLKDVKRRTANQVQALRDIRAREKAALANLHKYAAAEADFLKTGDYDAYTKAIFG